MIDGKKIVVVLPAYNAELTLRRTFREIPSDIVDATLLVDDGSSDRTLEIARTLGIRAVSHERNLGYGANQKTCYSLALGEGADIVVMIHPDYQYPPELVGPMARMVASGEYDIVLGSRILGGRAGKGGMPLYKYIGNRALTFLQNVLLQRNLSEYHTGFRAFRREVLTALPLLENRDDFLFDNQLLVQAVFFGFRIGEVGSPARYAPDSSSISFIGSLRYGCGVLRTSLQFALARMNLARYSFLDPYGRKVSPAAPQRIP